MTDTPKKSTATTARRPDCVTEVRRGTPGFSGANFQRPGFQSMLADIEAGLVGTVIVKDMSRLGRNYLQVGMYTEMIFPQNGVRFIAINDGVDSAQGENDFAPLRNILTNGW